MDFAFFAARLGWSLSDYEQTTPVQRRFIRKELETVTVEQSNLFKSAVQVAVANTLDKKRRKLWVKKRKKEAPPISLKEFRAIQKKYETQTPWTPWARKEVSNG